MVNPPHRKLTNILKRLREKITRKEASLYKLIEKNISEDLDKTQTYMNKQNRLKDELLELKKQEDEYVTQRKQYSYKITIKEMAEKEHYNKLDVESKLFQNILKMICYRAETSFAIALSSDYKMKENEMRTINKGKS